MMILVLHSVRRFDKPSCPHCHNAFTLSGQTPCVPRSLMLFSHNTSWIYGNDQPARCIPSPATVFLCYWLSVRESGRVNDHLYYTRFSLRFLVERRNARVSTPCLRQTARTIPSPNCGGVAGRMHSDYGAGLPAKKAKNYITLTSWESAVYPRQCKPSHYAALF